MKPPGSTIEEIRKTLQESETKYRLLFENSIDPVLLMDNGRFVDCNKAALEILHCPQKDQILGLRPSQISRERQPDGQLSEEKEKKAIYFADGERKDRFEWVHRSFDGVDFWVQVSLTVIPVNGKLITHVHWRDVTRQKQMEAAIQESEERYRSIFTLESDAIFLIDNETGQILETNNSASSLYGYSKEELLQKKNTDLSAEAQATRNATVQELTVVPLRYHRKKDGTVFPVEITATHLSWKGRRSHLASIRDITERKHAESRLHTLLSELEKKNKEVREAYEGLKKSEAMLVQSEKMASLGQLSAGIAHELKNPLSIILQGIAYVQSSVEDSTLIDACNRIKKSAIRADIVIQNLLSFARQAPPSFSKADMNILIEDALAMVEHQMNLQDIEIIRNYSHRTPTVKVDGNQIKQVFINIFINAAEAMRDGGTITIATAARSDKDGESCVEVAITDTGTGMPEEIIKNVLDPFFTTKRESGGTGLGLSVTKGIIDRHQGDIAIKSRQGTGTTVTIVLPCNPSEKRGAPDE